MRTVFSARWKKIGDEWIFDVCGDAFLYRMVRRLVFVQTAAGQGRLTSEELVQALKNRTKVLAGLAPPSGLALVAVRYDNPVGKLN